MDKIGKSFLAIIFTFGAFLFGIMLTFDMFSAVNSFKVKMTCK